MRSITSKMNVDAIGYANSKMSKHWDRENIIHVTNFYNYYTEYIGDKLLEEIEDLSEAVIKYQSYGQL